MSARAAGTATAVLIDGSVLQVSTDVDATAAYGVREVVMQIYEELSERDVSPEAMVCLEIEWHAPSPG